MNTIPGVQIDVRPYDPQWPVTFEAERSRIIAALGTLVVSIDHVGSTSVPGLAAKPLIDIALAVPDSTDEAAYVPPLEADGFVFVHREPEWFEHRLLRREPRRVNLHVFSAGCGEIAQMTGLRDWLRTERDDRLLYEATKRSLANRDWSQVQDYADAKSDVIAEIKRRAGLAPPAG